MIEVYYGEQRSGKTLSAMESACKHLAQGGDVWFYVCGWDRDEIVLYVWERWGVAVNYDQMHDLKDPRYWYKEVSHGWFDVKTKATQHLLIIDEAEGIFNSMKREKDLIEMSLRLSQAWKSGISIIFIVPAFVQLDRQVSAQSSYSWCHKEWSSFVLPGFGSIGRFGNKGYIRLQGNNQGMYLGNTEKRLKDKRLFLTYSSVGVIGCSGMPGRPALREVNKRENIFVRYRGRLAAGFTLLLLSVGGCAQAEKAEYNKLLQEMRVELSKVKSGNHPSQSSRASSLSLGSSPSVAIAGAASNSSTNKVEKREMKLFVNAWSEDGCLLNTGRYVRVGDYIRGMRVIGMKPGVGVLVEANGQQGVIADDY